MDSVKITRIQWSDYVADKLKVSAGDDLDEVRNQVITGVADLWHCTSRTGALYAVTRLDPGLEWVLMCGEGTGFGQFAPHFVKFARDNGLKLRTHVKRKGMIKLWAKYGLTIDEYVLRG